MEVCDESTRSSICQSPRKQEISQPLTGHVRRYTQRWILLSNVKQIPGLVTFAPFSYPRKHTKPTYQPRISRLLTIYLPDCRRVDKHTPTDMSSLTAVKEGQGATAGEKARDAGSLRSRSPIKAWKKGHKNKWGSARQ